MLEENTTIEQNTDANTSTNIQSELKPSGIFQTAKSDDKIIEKKKNKNDNPTVLQKPVRNPVWLSISEASKVGGVNTKTVRRALKDGELKYRISKNKYLIDFTSLIHYLYTKTKLKNKLKESGIGQYINEWRS